MYKLFLVDDEIELIEGLKELVDWERNNIQICGEANNGIDALEKILTLKPDIVIMDIRMPKMSGLELLEKIYSKGLSIKCIILSGYDDFSYAKQALNLSAYNYLLKPCRPSEILEAVLDAKNKLIEERSKEKIIQANMLKELILKPFSNTETNDSIFISSFDYANLQVIILSIDHSTVIYNLFDNKDIDFLKESIKNITIETLDCLNIVNLFEEDSSLVLLIAPSSSLLSEAPVSTTLLKLKDLIRSSLGFSITIAVGTSVNKLEALNLSYSSCKKALEYKFFLGEGNIIYADNISHYNTASNPYPLDEELKLMSYLRTGSIDDIHSILERFYSRLCQGGIPRKKNIQSYSLSLLGSINKFCIESDIDINSISKLGSPFDVILQCETINELKNQLEIIISNIFDRINSTNKNNSLVKLALDFITKNYDKDITLETVAKEIHFTPGYVSQLFKQETGVNFLEFLHKYRIEKSKALLKNKLLKNYEVAYMVGYTNEKHFSKTFKRYTGLTPSQYKSSIVS
ncbi:response regulator [Clostridium manihotivorum]|uniref:Stage 0 sporulation protein A homolog n=1 Tax=Clostridium manihotivorum TaxID=2320868 RepID=A0A410DPL2_9CLOT|nr:response regulator [Clostridium manihotivorum]QAA30991.1 DNA-binding response regulator [Clostridium manihotivorum]